RHGLARRLVMGFFPAATTAQLPIERAFLDWVEKSSRSLGVFFPVFVGRWDMVPIVLVVPERDDQPKRTADQDDKQCDPESLFNHFLRIAYGTGLGNATGWTAWRHCSESADLCCDT